MGLALVTALASAAAPVAAHSQAPHQPARRVVLTNVDDGRPVPVSEGDDIEVRLTGYRERGLNYTWSIPRTSDFTVLRHTAGGTTPNGGASAVFHQERPGKATISAQRHCRPDPGRLCPLIDSPWKVTVTGK
ncbi:hypothetical protein [Streptomyces sp. ISL-11]|uniref:hypothetical protein n=1 Tax=Streptomyces sp. ISL-11 TaxID=2819174 RepID=UPI001BE9B131|nr:hypothetical protein [Streptomyces sp. ISL-11]MBT2382122.1 hypothetical protein [Streptomyces sp. ISL-11]